jgi:phenylpropionate dioxygenase-like ring-hydroxylating dioxygenase large terminal subunit
MTPIPRLVASCRAGQSLPRALYTDPGVFDHDMRQVWSRNWIWVGHASQIPEPGDFLTFDYGPESIIVLRDRAGAVRAHMNVCRHRGSRLCTEAAGKARSLVCPYHGWTYDLDGRLRAGPMMGDGFDRAAHGLHPAAVCVFQGMILVNPDADAPPLDTALAELAPLTAPFGLDRLKVAHQASYPVPANWKLAYDNYLECYHCAPAHKEYSRSHTLKSPEEMRRRMAPLQARSAAIGLPLAVLDRTGDKARPACADLYYRRYPLFEGFETGSRTGAPLAQIGLLNHFLVYADHLVGYRFVPRGPQETDIQVVWMVRDDAQPGRDYDPEALTWLWDVTSRDDERIIRLNQQGVNSQFYRPGPLSQMEWAIPNFHASYLGLIAADLDDTAAPEHEHV